jgi:Flp pilus assembly protein TadD
MCFRGLPSALMKIFFKRPNGRDAVWMTPPKRDRIRNSLVGLAVKEFTADGWSILMSLDSRHDFLASKGIFSIPIQCIDETVQNFKAGASIVQTMEDDTRHFKSNRDQALAFIMGINFPLMPPPVLAQKGIIAVTPAEIGIITNITKMIEEIPVQIEPRTLLLLERNLDACLILSKKFFDSGQQAESLVWAHRGVAARIGGAPPFRKLFQHFLVIAEPEAAETFGRAVLSGKPGNAEMLRSLMDLAERQNKLEDAAKLGRRLVAQLPRDAEAHDALASVLLKQKDYSTAQEALSAAMILQPKNMSFVKKASQIAVLANDLANARRLLEHLVALSPEDISLHDTLVRVLNNQGDDAAAADAAAAAAAARGREATAVTEDLKLDPDNINLLRKAAQIAGQSGDLATARVWLQRLTDVAPTDPFAHDSLASLLLRQEDYAAAATAVATALKLAPDNPAFLRKSAQIAGQSGDLATARVWLQRLTDVAPTDPFAHDSLASLLLKQEDYPAAAAAAATALKLAPDNPAFLRKSAQIAIQSGDLVTARAWLQRLTDVAPTDPFAHDSLASLLLRQGDNAAAATAAATALKLAPDNPAFLRKVAQIATAIRASDLSGKGQ